MKIRLVLIILAITALLIGLLIWLVTSSDYQSARTATLSTPKPGKPVPTLVWAYGDATTVEHYKSTIQELQVAYPNPITLRLFPSRDQMLPALQQAAKAGNLPDVFLGELQDLNTLYLAKEISPIPLKDTPSFEWIPDIFQTFVRGDSLLAYPSEYSVLVLYYNRRQFDRLGLAYADTYWTWENLLEIGRALYRDPSSPNGVVYGLEYDLNLEFWNSLACQYGKGIYEGSRWNWGAPEAVGAIHDSLNLLVGLEQVGGFCAPMTHSALPEQFIEGHSAMAIAGPGLRAVLQKDPAFEWGCTLLPRRTIVATPLSARGWAVSAQTKSIDAAQGLARALSRVVADDWLSARTSGTFPSEPSNDYTSVFQISLRFAQPPYTGPDAEKVKPVIDQALNLLSNPTPIDIDPFLARLNASLTALSSPSIPIQPSVAEPASHGN